MTDAELGRRRLVAQGLVTRPYRRPADAVAAFGAMQGQDLPGVMASAALRSTGDVADVIADMDAGRIVRGYPMRGTVFAMDAADVVWVSQLCNAGALRAAAKRRTQLGLDDTMVERARERTLELLEAEPKGLSRASLMEHWSALGNPVDKGRGYHVLAHLIGLGLVCFGPWNGSDQNVVATSSWTPADATLAGRFNDDRVAAVTELLRRYVTSHGPATLRDFAWWTKLPLKEVRAAWAELGDDFEHDGSAEALIWRPGLLEEVAELGAEVDAPLLLPGFDEFVLGYRDRLFAMTQAQHELLVPGNNGVFGRSVVAGGQVVGIWARAGRPGRRSLELRPFGRFTTKVEGQLGKHFEAFPFVGA